MMRTLAAIIACSVLLAGRPGTVAGGSPVDSPSPPNADKFDQPAERHDGFAPGLAIFALLVVVVILVLLGMGAVLAVVFVGIVAGLLGFGILTLSTLTGVISRRPGTAVKAFFLQLGGVAGLACGAGTAVLTKWLAKSQISTWSAIVTGGIAGLLVGIVLAVLFNYAWDRLLRVLLNREGKSHDVAFPQSGTG